MSNRLVVKNWDRFQHYKDRCPPWIKLHRSLLDDMVYMSLPVEAQALLPLFWLLAAETSDGSITGDPRTLAWRLRRDRELVERAIAACVASGMLAESEAAQPPEENRSEAAQTLAKKNGFAASRYIAKDVKDEVLARDSGRCRACESDKDIEFDHIVPVSAGGDGSLDNVWLLCRRCNRKKRSQSLEQFLRRLGKSAQPSAQVCADSAELRSSESAYSEREAETETETERSIDSAQSPEPEKPAEDHFARFWDAYDYKVAKPAAERAWKRHVKPADVEQVILQAQTYRLATPDKKFRAHPATWLNQRRWEDEDQPQLRDKRGGDVTHIPNMPLGSESCGCLACAKERAKRGFLRAVQ